MYKNEYSLFDSTVHDFQRNVMLTLFVRKVVLKCHNDYWYWKNLQSTY
jgi:hypothetical protein